MIVSEMIEILKGLPQHLDVTIDVSDPKGDMVKLMDIALIYQVTTPDSSEVIVFSSESDPLTVDINLN